MAVNNYTGIMGTGKSYEVVSTVILDALKSGRRVVTNIDGISFEAIEAYLVDVKKCDAAKLGQLVCVTNDDINRVGFFPDETKPDQPSVVVGGDLVCIDECWLFWSTDHKISNEHMLFFRMHRHYTHPQTGVTCDIVLMIQDVGTLNRKIRVVVEMTTRTVKLKSIGSPSSYRLELYEGYKLTKKALIDTFVKRYDKAIFPLYKSYAVGAGKETVIDKRQNILTNPKIWVLFALVILLGGVGIWNTMNFFSRGSKSQQGAKSTQQAPSNGKAISGAPDANQVATVAVIRPDFSLVWRYVGTLSANGENFVVVSNQAGVVRVESPSAFNGQGVTAVGLIDGEKVTKWSGVASSFSNGLTGASK